jgi:hypothetical protein
MGLVGAGSELVGAGKGLVGAGMGVVGAGMGLVGAGMKVVGAGIGLVGAGMQSCKNLGSMVALLQGKFEKSHEFRANFERKNAQS